MGLPTIRPPRVQDYQDQYQRDARAAIKQLDAPGNRRSTAVVTLTTTTKAVAHQLGKIPVAWNVVDQNANAVIWREGTANQDTIPMRASATVTVTIQFW